MGWTDEIDVRINKIFCDSVEWELSLQLFFFSCRQWFSFSRFSDLLGSDSCSTWEKTALFYGLSSCLS